MELPRYAGSRGHVRGHPRDVGSNGDLDDWLTTAMFLILAGSVGMAFHAGAATRESLPRP